MLISISSLCTYLLLMKVILSNGKMKQCRRKHRLITGRRNDLYELVDAISSQEIILECHFCEDKDDHFPKIWYKQVRPFLTSPEELTLNSTLDLKLLRVHVNPEHALVIKNYTPSMDEGIYYCQGMNGEESENKYNYLIDTVLNFSEKNIEVGDSFGWRKYYEKYLEPINRALRDNFTDSSEYSYKESTYGTFNLEAMTEWETWGNCVVCGLPEGQKKRRGKCRIKATKYVLPLITKAQEIRSPITRRQTNSAAHLARLQISSNTSEYEANSTAEALYAEVNKYPMEQMFRETPIVSCKSVHIFRSEGISPNVTKMLQETPDFIQVERCNGLCRKEGAPSKLQFDLVGRPQAAHSVRTSDHDEAEMAEDVIREAEKEEEEEEDAIKGSGFRMMELEHGDKLTLVCPGASATSVVTWKKDGSAVVASGAQDDGPVDALGTLRIEAVGRDDSGNYACAVNDVDSAVVGVSVQLPPMLKTAEFLRHNVYFAVIIGICLVIYCSGLVVAYTQKHRFNPPGYAKVNTMEKGGAQVGF